MFNTACLCSCDLQESALEEFLFGSGAAVGKLLAKPEGDSAGIADLVRQVSCHTAALCCTVTFLLCVALSFIVSFACRAVQYVCNLLPACYCKLCIASSSIKEPASCLYNARRSDCTLSAVLCCAVLFC